MSDIPHLRELEEMPPREWYPLSRGVDLSVDYLRVVARHLTFEISADLELRGIVGEPDDGSVAEALRVSVSLIDEAVENIMLAVELMRDGRQFNVPKP